MFSSPFLSDNWPPFPMILPLCPCLYSFSISNSIYGHSSFLTLLQTPQRQHTHVSLRWEASPKRRTQEVCMAGCGVCCCCSVTKSCLTLCDPIDYSPPGSFSPPLSPGVCSNSSPLSRWHHPIISSSASPFSCCPQSFPASGSFPMSWLFPSGGQSIGASASATVLPIFRVDFLWDWPVWSCSPGDSQESSPAQFKSISSLVLSLLDGSTLTSVHDYWKNHSFDYMDLCWQSGISSL